MSRAALLSVVLSGVGAVTAGCAGNASKPDGTGGQATAAPGAERGGASGVSNAPPAQGNLTLSVQQPTTGNCPVPGKTYVVGNPDGPNLTAPGDRLIDGEQGAQIKCAVHGSGPFTFTASLRGISSESDSVTVTITDGMINADKLTGSATISVNTPQLAGTFVSAAGACTVAVIDGNVKPGSLWATASCASVQSPATGLACGVGPTTTFVIENCDSN